MFLPNSNEKRVNIPILFADKFVIKQTRLNQKNFSFSEELSRKEEYKLSYKFL